MNEDVFDEAGVLPGIDYEIELRDGFALKYGDEQNDE